MRGWEDGPGNILFPLTDAPLQRSSGIVDLDLFGTNSTYGNWDIIFRGSRVARQPVTIILHAGFFLSAMRINFTASLSALAVTVHELTTHTAALDISSDISIPRFAHCSSNAWVST